MQLKSKSLILLVAMWTLDVANAQTQTSASATTATTHKPWYETISLRGYAQLRYNQLGATNSKLVSDQGDKSIGGNNSFFLRRARLVLTAQPTDMVTVYIQPDFAATPVSPGPGNFLQVRDLYADVFLT